MKHIPVFLLAFALLSPAAALPLPGAAGAVADPRYCGGEPARVGRAVQFRPTGIGADARATASINGSPLVRCHL